MNNYKIIRTILLCVIGLFALLCVSFGGHWDMTILNKIVFGVVFWCLLVVGINILLCMIPANMAEKRGRSKIGWFLFSFFLSFLTGVIVLACLGETDEKRKEKIIEEEELRQTIRNKYAD